MFYIIFLILLIFVGIFELVLLVYVGERLWAMCVKKQYPSVSCCGRHTVALVSELNKRYSNMKTFVDIGSGFGRMVRAVARGTDFRVFAIENVLLSVYVAKFVNFVTRTRKVDFVYADAFKYIAKPNKKFDIGVAYLGPGTNARLRDIMSHFRVMITLDVEIPGVKPTRIIDLHGGYTNYPRVGKFPHRLFIYEIE